MKRMLILLLVAAMLVSMLSGCQQAQPSVTDTASPTTQTEPTVSHAPAQTQPAAESPAAFTVSELIISEVMPDNRKLAMGHEQDWVELYNREETAVNLDNYYLTDDLNDPDALSLSGMQIPAEGYLAVTLDNDAAFQLSTAGETIYLTCQGEVISELTFGASQNGESFGAEGACRYPTPGYANTEDGYLSYVNDFSLPELIISEVLPSNSTYLPVGLDYYDMVEVKNISESPVNLKEYYLADKWENTQRFIFPDVTLAPGEYYVVYCSGNTSLGSNHAPFQISASGETLYLARRGTFIDALSVPADLKYNESYGRDGKVPSYLETPTPGAENSPGFLTGIAAPAASVESGLYDEAVTVELSGEGIIYYTLDGRRPTVYSNVYTKPITVDDVTTIRAFCVSGDRSSPLTAYTYVVGKEHDLPVVTLAIPQYSLTGQTGVLNNIEASYEHEGVLTLIEDGEEKFSVPCGFRLHGNDSRKGAKQNFQLRFRAEYGASKLEYPLFDDRDIDEYDSLLLKGGSEDWYRAMIRDELSTGLVDGTTELYTQAIKPVVLYLGGQYWGIYYLRERFSDEYVASHLDVEPESVDIVYSSAGYRQVGSETDFTALKNYVRTHDMRTAENYAYLTDRINVISLMDWYICRSYVGDKDLANIRRFRSTEADGKWQWMYFDLDWGFFTDFQPLSSMMEDWNGEWLLMNAVFENPEGRDTFLKRYAYLLNTILNEEYIISAIDSLAADISPEMPRDRARWGQTTSNWESYVQSMRDFVEDGARTKTVLKDLKSYFSLSDEEMKAYFGDLYQ